MSEFKQQIIIAFQTQTASIRYNQFCTQFSNIWLFWESTGTWANCETDQLLGVPEKTLDRRNKKKCWN